MKQCHAFTAGLTFCDCVKSKRQETGPSFGTNYFGKNRVSNERKKK
jgi:hypothetical protein